MSSYFRLVNSEDAFRNGQNRSCSSASVGVCVVFRFDLVNADLAILDLVNLETSPHIAFVAIFDPMNTAVYSIPPRYG